MDIKGTVITLENFLFNVDSEIRIECNGERYPILSFKKGRQLYIPDYQREIRWQKENLFSLMNDISHNSKFLGNIILSTYNKKDFNIIDGQQRLISLNMLVTYIMNKYNEELGDITELIKINVNQFENYELYRENKYTLNGLTETKVEDIITSDKFGQLETLNQLYNSIEESKLLNNVANATHFLTNLKRCTLNVIVSNETYSNLSAEYYIDVNLKGIKLDTEDIFKGYLFTQDSSSEIRSLWIELKSQWIEFENTTGKKNLYPLMKILNHVIICYILSKKEYNEIIIDDNMNLTNPCIINESNYYTGDHIIKVVKNNTHMKNVLRISKEFIKFMLSILTCENSCTSESKKLFKNIDSKEINIICNFIKKTILDKSLTIPKMLILKYFLSINNNNNKQAIKEIYAIYFFNTIFLLFGNKKNDSKIIKQIAQSNNYYSDIISEIKNYFENDKIIDSKLTAIGRWNSNFDNEELKYKCKSLATIYNYFKIEDDKITILSFDDLYEFLNNENLYSIEHFIVNQSCKTTYDNDFEYELPNLIKKYNTYIFNFIFIPRNLNNELNTKPLNEKINIIEDKLEEVHCEYSKMVIKLVKKAFINQFEISETDEITKDDLNKYWLSLFRDEYLNFTHEVIKNIIEHFK